MPELLRWPRVVSVIPEPLAVDPVFRALDSLPAMITYVDASLCYAYASRPYCEWWGLDRRSVIGRLVREVLPPEAWAKVEPAYAAALQGKSFELPCEFRSGGLVRSMKVSYAPDLDSLGAVKGIFVHVNEVISLAPPPAGDEEAMSQLFRDLNCLKKTQRELTEALRTKDEFFSIASHELRTPLTALKLQNELRKRRLIKGEIESVSAQEVTQLIDRNQTQLDRLARIVEEMLDISQLQAGRLPIIRSETHLSVLVREIADGLQAHFQSVGSEIHLDLEPEIWLWVDPARIEQVIVNLLSNAAKYGAGKPVCLSLKKSQSAVEIEVRDEGRGIDPRDQQRIFERFERAAECASIHGLGLGLYIVKGLVEGHGGKVFISSVPGRGATFTVSLPLL